MNRIAEFLSVVCVCVCVCGTVRGKCLGYKPASISDPALPRVLNHLTPNGHYMGRNAQLTSRCCILYIYSTNIRTEYFKHAA